MSYRDELIRQFKETQYWDTLSSDQQIMLERFDEDLCKNLLCQLDQEELRSVGERLALESSDPEVQKEAVTGYLERGLICLVGAFDGKVVSRTNNSLSCTPLGTLLYQFVAEAKNIGLTLPTIAIELHRLNLEALMILKMLGDKERGVDDDE